MNTKTYFTVSGTVFALVALLHAIRMVLGWQAVVGSWSLPMLASGLAVVVAGYLAYTAFSLRKTNI